LGLWSLEERRNRADLIEAFKMISGISTPLLKSMELSSINNLRGHNIKLKKNRSHLDVRKFFFSERLVNRWNSLDPDIVCAKSVNVSKKGLDRMRRQRMGFFEDLVRQTLWLHKFSQTGVATPGELPGELTLNCKCFQSLLFTLGIFYFV